MFKELALKALEEGSTAEQLLEQTFDTRQKVIFNFIKYKQIVDKDVFCSFIANYFVIIDGNEGEVYHFNNDNIEFKVEDGKIYARRWRKEDWACLYSKGEFDFSIFKPLAYGNSGQHRYKSIVINHPYYYEQINLRIHLLIMAMYYSYEVLDAIGQYDRLLDIHHVNRNKGNNSKMNIIVVTHEKHLELDKELRKKEKYSSKCN